MRAFETIKRRHLEWRITNRVKQLSELPELDVRGKKQAIADVSALWAKRGNK